MSHDIRSEFSSSSAFYSKMSRDIRFEYTSANEEEFIHVIENVLGLELFESPDLATMNYHRELTSTNSIDELALLSKKELHRLPERRIRDVQSLQLCLKVLQEKGIYSINRSFDYYSIDYEDFSNFVSNPISKDILDSDKDPGISPFETHGFTLNES